MKDRRLVLLATIICLLLLSVLAASPPRRPPDLKIFVSSFSSTTGGHILKVNTRTGKVSSIFSEKTGFKPGDIAVSSKEQVYVCDPTHGRIIRMDMDGKNDEVVYDVATATTEKNPAKPQGPWFNFRGDLYFNTEDDTEEQGGIWTILGKDLDAGIFPATPKQVAFTAGPVSEKVVGQGLAFAINGDLLIVDQSKSEVLISSPESPIPPDAEIPFGAVSNFAVNPLAPPEHLAAPTGVAVKSNGDVLVANGGALKNIVRFNFLDSSLAVTYASLADEVPFFLEFISDDTLFVATSDTAMATDNGKIWRITRVSGADPCPGDFLSTDPDPDPAKERGTCTELLVALQNKWGGAIGLAVPPTSRTIDDPTLVGDTQEFHFGNHIFEVTGAGNCKLVVTATETNPDSIKSDLEKNFPVLPSPSLTVAGIPFAGRGGWVIKWEAVPEDPSCIVPAPLVIYVAAFFPVDFDFNTNPRLIKDFELIVESFGYFPNGLVDEIPDAGTSGRLRIGLSDFVIADVSLLEGKVGFCDFEPPLEGTTFDNPAVYNSGRNVTLKFNMAAENGNCEQGPFISGEGNLEAVLSVAQLVDEDNLDVFIRKVVTPSGDANEIPLFRASGDGWTYNLHTTEPITNEKWPLGLYVATVVFDKGSLPQQAFFRLE